MIVVKNKFIPFGKYDAIVLWPFIFAKKELYAYVLRHEKIHGRQQVEMFIVFFFLWYLIEWLIKLPIYGKKAYSNVSFEREAYGNQYKKDYLDKRKHYAWFRYIRKSQKPQAKG